MQQIRNIRAAGIELISSERKKFTIENGMGNSRPQMRIFFLFFLFVVNFRYAEEMGRCVASAGNTCLTR